MAAAAILSHTGRFERRRARYERHQELGHVRDLVKLRRILARNGATLDELRSYDAEIDRQKRALGRPYFAAA